MRWASRSRRAPAATSSASASREASLSGVAAVGGRSGLLRHTALAGGSHRPTGQPGVRGARRGRCSIRRRGTTPAGIYAAARPAQGAVGPNGGAPSIAGRLDHRDLVRALVPPLTRPRLRRRWRATDDGRCSVARRRRWAVRELEAARRTRADHGCLDPQPPFNSGASVLALPLTNLLGAASSKRPTPASPCASGSGRDR
jgi:hypothetical protein